MALIEVGIMDFRCNKCSGIGDVMVVMSGRLDHQETLGRLHSSNYGAESRDFQDEKGTS